MLNDQLFHQGLNFGAANGLLMTVCKAKPTTYLEAVNAPSNGTPGFNVSGAGRSLAGAELTVAANASNGQTITLAAKSAGATVVEATLASDDLWFAWLDTNNSTILQVFDEPSNQALTVGNAINFPLLSTGFTFPNVRLNPLFMQQGLNWAQANGLRLNVCKSLPTTYTEAVNAPADATPGFNVSGAGRTLAAADFSVVLNGLGYDLTITAKTAAATVTADSLATDNLFFAWVDDANSQLVYVFDEPTDQPLTTGNSINYPALLIGLVGAA